MERAQPGVYRRPLRRAFLVGGAALLLIYPVDWMVSSSLAATLKGNRFEVYTPTVEPVACSRSLLPQAGAGACWWLRGHQQQITQY